MCPKSSRSLEGKHLSVSYIGILPYINNRAKPVVGCDVTTLKILAQKFNFSYSLIREKSYNMKTSENGTKSGLTYAVRIRPAV
jgi:hypothetical protein